jgi:hypothetical protein
VDPEVLLLALLGGLALAGRLRRTPSPAGRRARSAVQSAVQPAQDSARSWLPIGGGRVATVLGAAGAVIGEAIGDLLDGTAAAADLATGRRAAGSGDRAIPPRRTSRPATAAGPAKNAATTKRSAVNRTPRTTKKAAGTSKRGEARKTRTKKA